MPKKSKNISKKRHGTEPKKSKNIWTKLLKLYGLIPLKVTITILLSIYSALSGKLCFFTLKSLIAFKETYPYLHSHSQRKLVVL
jgi:hypothetical protein